MNAPADDRESAEIIAPLPPRQRGNRTVSDRDQDPAVGSEPQQRDRRTRLLEAIGPHKQVGEARTVPVPAGHGIIAHNDYLAPTACGREVTTTLVTRQDHRVRCPECLAAMTGTGDLRVSAISSDPRCRAGRRAQSPRQIPATLREHVPGRRGRRAEAVTPDDHAQIRKADGRAR